MARKSQNPVDQHRRQQQLKELKKNKEKRIKERDERVKETGTVSSIKAAIAEVEKRNKHGNYNAADTRKLERLRKELKIVQQAQQQKPPVAPPTIEPQQPLTELDDPRKSVYYDAQFNPYGAPPPGRPRMYHRRGGGVTTNKDEAVVPGEEGTPPPPPQPRDERNNIPQMQAPHYSQRQQFQPRHTPPPPPPLPSKGPPQQRSTNSTPPPPPPPPPADGIPLLPQPSESVQRLARGKKRKLLAADIWASEQEIVYEKVHSGLDLEEGHVVNTKKEANPEQAGWYYLDDSDVVQGPFEFSQLYGWYQHGYFAPSTTRVRRGAIGEFKIMASNHQWQKELKHFEAPNIDEQPDSGVQDRISALRGEVNKPRESIEDEVEADSIQARIDALKQGRMVQQPDPDKHLAEQYYENDGHQNDENRASSDYKEKTIAVASRQTTLPVSQIDQVQSQPHESEHDESEDDEQFKMSFQDRINALKRERVNNQHQLVSISEVKTVKEAVGNDEAVIGDQKGHKTNIETMQSRMNMSSTALTPIDDDRSSPMNFGPAAYPSMLSDSQDDYQSVQYPLTDFDSQPTFPANYDDVVAPYPVDLAEVSYPIDSAELASAVGAGYPVTDAYPVIGTYPVEDKDDGVTTGIESTAGTQHVRDLDTNQQKLPPKKFQEVDRDVISLLPTHLQRNRKTAKLKPSPKPQVNPQTKRNTSTTDALDEFINDIENI